MFSNNTTEDLSSSHIEFESSTTNFNSSFEANSSDDVYHAFKRYPTPVVVFLAIVIVFIIIFAVGGNVMVVLTILRHRGMRTRTNMFIVNLAVADILVAVLDMPVSLITVISGRWVFYDALCNLNAFTMALFLISSIHTLMYISVHKYISITKPFSRAMTPRRIKFMITASWTWAAICATGPLVGLNKNLYKPGASQCGPAIPSDLPAIVHSLLITFSNYVIPLCVMIFCYTGIFYEIHVHMRRIRETSNIDLENTVAQQKKVAVTLVLVLACFLFCWTPFIMYSNAMVIRKGRIASILNPLAYWCGYFNSACNPIIYAFRSPSFRKGYKEIMCGAQSAKLSAVNSMSFRSRSARGVGKHHTNEPVTNSPEPKMNESAHDPIPTEKFRRQRTLLSQTSWRSMPLIPTLMRSFSTSNAPGDDIRPQTPEYCGLCGLCFKKTMSMEHPRTSSGVRSSGRHSLSHEIKEEDEEETSLKNDLDDIGMSSGAKRHSLSHEIKEEDEESMLEKETGLNKENSV